MAEDNEPEHVRVQHEKERLAGLTVEELEAEGVYVPDWIKDKGNEHG